jgi:hypothetical protein
VVLSRAAHVPVVFGYFPLDGEGAMESQGGLGSSSQGLGSTPPERAEIGPCNSLCRGACGPDCTLVNCTKTEQWFCEESATGTLTGNETRWDVFNCGYHEGCIWHDQCFDDCNRGRCDSWAAAMCRHNTVTGCDVTAAYNHGRINCIQWARGKGTFTGRTDYPYDHLAPSSRPAPMCDGKLGPAIELTDSGTASYPWSPPEGFIGDTLTWASDLSIQLQLPAGAGYRIQDRGTTNPSLDLMLNSNNPVSLQYSYSVASTPARTLVWEQGDAVLAPGGYERRAYTFNDLYISDESGDPSVIETDRDGTITGMTYQRSEQKQASETENGITISGAVGFDPATGYDHNRIVRGGGWFHVGLGYTLTTTTMVYNYDLAVYEEVISETSGELNVGSFAIMFWWDPDRVLEREN